MLFKHWTSWSCVPYAMVHRSVLQWTRGERVPLSLYFIFILWRLVITAFHRRSVKVDGSLFSQTITSAKVRFFFYIFTTRPSISSLSQRPTGHESRRFSCQCRVKNKNLMKARTCTVSFISATWKLYIGLVKLTKNFNTLTNHTWCEFAPREICQFCN